MPSDPDALAVIDTNVLLDWLVFEDPSVTALAGLLEAGGLRWIATQAMLDELADVLRRPGFERWQPRLGTAMARACQRCELVEAAPAPPAAQLHCSDPDDQKFIDLALTHSARWLLSRDKALLRLGRKARLRGIEVLTPATWGARMASPVAPP